MLGDSQGLPRPGRVWRLSGRTEPGLLQRLEGAQGLLRRRLSGGALAAGSVLWPEREGPTFGDSTAHMSCRVRPLSRGKAILSPLLTRPQAERVRNPRPRAITHGPGPQRQGQQGPDLAQQATSSGWVCTPRGSAPASLPWLRAHAWSPLPRRSAPAQRPVRAPVLRLRACGRCPRRALRCWRRLRLKQVSGRGLVGPGGASGRQGCRRTKGRKGKNCVEAIP